MHFLFMFAHKINFPLRALRLCQRWGGGKSFSFVAYINQGAVK